MRKLLLFSAVLFGATTAASAQSNEGARQQKKDAGSVVASCCARPSATEAFALLASSQEFVGGHDAPLPYSYHGEGQMIEFKLPDGTVGHAFEVKSDKPSNKYLLVYQEWWGLNDYIKKETDRFARELPGVNVLAIDLYDGRVADAPEDAARLMQNVKTDRAVALIKGAMAYAGPQAEFASVGWCFGGGWSLQSALLGGQQTVGCVMYYGMPEKDVTKLKTLHSDVLGLFAEQDKSISPEMVQEFQKNMKAAGKKVTVKEYPAVHAFANPSNPKYNKELAEDAHQRALAYLKARLKV